MSGDLAHALAKNGMSATDEQLKSPETRLAVCAAENDFAGMDDLIDSGVSPNSRILFDPAEPTQLVLVTTQNKPAPMRLLLAHRRAVALLADGEDSLADPDLPNIAGHTPLMIAARFGQLDAASLLVQHGADTDVQSRSGDTALMFAASEGHSIIVQMLLRFGANPDLQSAPPSCDTALIHAAIKGHERVVALLLEAGARTDLRSSPRNRNALEWAKQYGHKPVARLLWQRQLKLAAAESQADVAGAEGGAGGGGDGGAVEERRLTTVPSAERAQGFQQRAIVVTPDEMLCGDGTKKVSAGIDMAIMAKAEGVRLLQLGELKQAARVFEYSVRVATDNLTRPARKEFNAPRSAVTSAALASTTDDAIAAIPSMSAAEKNELCASVRLASLLNMALCCIKLEDWPQSEVCTTAAIEDDPFCVKALFRRAKTRRMMRRPVEAMLDLRCASAVAPLETEVLQAIVETADEVAEVKERERLVLEAVANGCTVQLNIEGHGIVDGSLLEKIDGKLAIRRDKLLTEVDEGASRSADAENSADGQHAAESGTEATAAGAAHTDDDSDTEEASRQARRNLQMLTPYILKKGLWRVRLSDACEVVEVIRGIAGKPPQPGEFSFMVRGDGSLPQVGKLSRLSKLQVPYVRTLINDIDKVCKAREIAYVRPDDDAATHAMKLAHLRSMTEKVGVLPQGPSELADCRKKQEEEAVERQKQRLQMEEEQAMKELGAMSIDEAFLREQKKREKRIRQKERRRLEKEQGVAESSTN